MKHARTLNVTVQLTILFVAVLTISQTLGLGHRYLVQSEALTSLEIIRVADRIATLTSLVDSAEADARPGLIQHFKGSNLPIAWTRGAWLADSSRADEKSQLLRGLLVSVIPPSAAREVRVGYVSSSFTQRAEAALAQNWSHINAYPAPLGQVVDEFVSDPTFLVSIMLSDGTWLNMVAAYADTLDLWPFDEIGFLVSMVVLVAVLSIWAIRRLTAPFRLFAAAAARLGTDVNAPPLTENGPAEVLGAIQAFNEMQRRLQRFIADRTEMLAAVSHDLRTPITRLRLRAEFVDDRLHRRKMLADLDEMEQMIAGVLSFAKDDICVEETVQVDLTAMLQSICDDMADRGRDVTFEADGRLHYPCRRGSMRRCFTNLIDNAVKHGDRAEIRAEITDGEVVIRIEDRGPGIPDHLREDVFRPFFRLEPSRNRDRGGSGLGLSVARSIARAHGGEVVLGNRAGGGLCVAVRLPLAARTMDGRAIETASAA